MIVAGSLGREEFGALVPFMLLGAPPANVGAVARRTAGLPSQIVGEADLFLLFVIEETLQSWWRLGKPGAAVASFA